MNKSAILSESGIYRYELRRFWDSSGKGLVNFIGLNPSTADAEQDDPTIRRCISFARDWGYDGLIMTNLFAYRLTNSAQLKTVIGPHGPCNWHYLESAATEANLVIAAWGSHKMARIQGQRTFSRLEKVGIREIRCICQSKQGAPRHPLYLKADLTPASYLHSK